MFVPGQTGARAFYGHPFESIDAKNKQKQAEGFYRGESETLSPPANYIFYGPSEQKLGQPDTLSELSPVYSADGVTIYRMDE